MNCNTAIFYDIENLNGLFTNKNKQYLQLHEVYKRVQQVDGVQGITIQRAYADWASIPHRNLRASILQIGIDPVQVFNTNPNDKLKNAADVILIIDVVETIMKRPDIDNYVIASGDGIFAFLSKKLHEHGKRVIGCGFTQNVNNLFKASCDYFIDLEYSDKALVSCIHCVKEVSEAVLEAISPPLAADEAVSEDFGSAPDKAQETVEPEKPKPQQKSKSSRKSAKEEKPVAKTLPKSFPKNTITEALNAAGLSVLPEKQEDWAVLLKVKEVIDAIFQNPKNAKLELNISQLKTYIGFYVPDFRSTRFRCKRFIDFIRFIFTQSPYCMCCVNGTTYKAMLRGVAKNKKQIAPDVSSLSIIMADGRTFDSLFKVNEQSAFTYAFRSDQKQMAKKGEDELAEQKGQEAFAQGAAAAEVEEAFFDSTEGFGEMYIFPETGRDGKFEEVSIADASIDDFEMALDSADESSMIDIDEQDEEFSGLIALGSLDESEIAEEDDEAGPVFIIPGTRRLVRQRMREMFASGAMPESAIAELTSVDFSRKTFGIKCAALKELNPADGMRNQRFVDGKAKYWMEIFEANGKRYYVFKNWTDGGSGRLFLEWLEKIE
ncbi:MAG: NYN domain-containing protein [Clostridiales bacterium]|jgi:uncharacterized LabA/DUF88 family protein|nr:NYN domain-containing protein [Clostridiales bacterium]